MYVVSYLATAILIIYIVRDRLILVAIDELHLNSKEQWGGSFRPDMSKLHVLRQRLPFDVPILGVTATLTKNMTTDVLDSCGFRHDTVITRYSIYRNTIKFHLEATSDSVIMQKRVVHTILRRGRQRYSQVLSTLLMPKAIFYVQAITDTEYLRRSIIEWFREAGFPEMDRYTCVFHSELTEATKSRVQNEFSTGAIRLIVCTIAYGVGVNPPNVEFICQTGRCTASEAVQKAGRGGRQRGGDTNREGVLQSYFFWFVKPRIIGERAERGSVLLGPRGYPRRVPTRIQIVVQEGEAEESDSSIGSRGSEASRNPTGSRVNSASARRNAEWRATNTHEGEWELWNRDRCYRSTILWPFLENPGKGVGDNVYRCGGCNRCTPPGEILAELQGGLPNDETNAHVELAVRQLLEALRKEISAELIERTPWHPIVILDPDSPGSYILTSADIKQFSRRYPAVRRGNLFNWIWTHEYGNRVISRLREVVHGSPEPEPVVTSSNPLLLLASAAIGPTSSTSARLTPHPRLALADISNWIDSTPRTARGPVATKKRKGDSGRQAALRRVRTFGSSPPRGE